MHLANKKQKAGTCGRSKSDVVNRIKLTSAGCAWVTGLLIASSDSPYMPWLNILGVLMFVGISLVSGQWLSGGKSRVLIEISGSTR